MEHFAHIETDVEALIGRWSPREHRVEGCEADDRGLEHHTFPHTSSSI